MIGYFSVVGMFYVIEMSQMSSYFNQNKVLPIYVTDIVDSYYFQILSEKKCPPFSFFTQPIIIFLSRAALRRGDMVMPGVRPSVRASVRLVSALANLFLIRFG